MADKTYLTVAENNMNFSYSDIQTDASGAEYIIITIKQPNEHMSSGYSSANFKYPGAEMSNISGFLPGQLLWIRMFVEANAAAMFKLAKSGS